MGDTIRSVSKTVAKRSMKEGGVVIEERSILNQHGEVVQSGRLTLLVAKRPGGVKRAAWLTAGAAPVLWGAYTWGSHLAHAGQRVARRAGAPRSSRSPSTTVPIAFTPRVLDILAREGVRDAFFLIGRRAAHAPAVARRIAAAGHDLGNHTWSHRSLWRCGPDRTEREIGDGHDAIAGAAGAPPRFFRAPWGKTNLAIFPAMRRLDTPCVFWTVQTEGRRAGGSRRAGAARRRASPAGRHLRPARRGRRAGRRDAPRRDLPALIAALRREGYALVPLGDLL